MEAFVLITALVLLIILGMPVGIAMVILPTIFIAFTNELPLSIIPYQMYEALARPPLIAIPFFILTGELMNSSQISERLMALSKALVGRVRGGIAQVNIIASLLFAGMNGSAVADTVASGTILIPAMKKAGYSAAFAAALTATASTIGGIIPPSIVMVLLASGLGLSVGGLFVAGILPGLLITGLLMLTAYAISVYRQYERSETPFTFKGALIAFKGASVAMTIPLVLICGIVFGIFTASEAGAITAIAAIFIGAFVYKTLTLSSLMATVGRSVKLTGSVFIIVAAAGPFSWLLNRIGALQGLDAWLTSYSDQPVMFAIVLVGFIFVTGMIMDAVANIVVLGPVLIKICLLAGYPELQAAMIVTVGFLMGTVTPPVGICFFTASFLAKEKLELVALALIPFLLVETLFLFLLIAIPGLSTWLPGLFGFS